MAGQTVRQTFTLEVGALTETVTVEGTAPLVSTASFEQLQTFESLKLTELSLGRRNVSNILRLASGVDVGANRTLRINGIDVCKPTTSVPAGFYNLAPPTDWGRFNFGATLDPCNAYRNDGWVNLGPRVGFATIPMRKPRRRLPGSGAICCV